jgi:hypothetical protein
LKGHKGTPRNEPCKKLSETVKDEGKPLLFYFSFLIETQHLGGNIFHLWYAVYTMDNVPQGRIKRDSTSCGHLSV